MKVILVQSVENLGDAGDSKFFQDIAESKYDMKIDKNLKEPDMPMPDKKDIDIRGLMARGE